MIQRIQTVFLFLAFFLLGLLFFMPFASILSTEIYSISLAGITSLKPAETIQQPFWLSLFGLVTSILVLVIIFLFKKRRLQMRLTLVAMFLSLALNGAMYLALSRYSTFLSAGTEFKAVFILPVISAILLYMAYRSIKKDEDLIKSADRIR